MSRDNADRASASGVHLNTREYHQATKHSLASVQSNRRGLDWPNQPLPFKIYTSLPPRPLPLTFAASGLGALAAIAGPAPSPSGSVDVDALARLCYFSNGITRVLRGMPFRAAACTGALFHIELYLVCDDLPDLPAGVYHYAAHDNALRQLREGDMRDVLVRATATQPTPATLVLTSTWWRNAWKYEARAYRHAFWDSGTILANLLAVAAAQSLAARVIVGFADEDVNRLLDVEPSHEAAIAVVALGSETSPAPATDAVLPLNLPTRALSRHAVSYPEIVDTHSASSLPSGAAASAWRAGFPAPAAREPVSSSNTSIEQVILRRGSSRRFSHEPIPRETLQTLLTVATSPFPSDAWVATDPYVIVNAVDGLTSGSYIFNRQSGQPELLRQGDFRREAAHLDLGQPLAGDAAVNVYWLADLQALDDRGYRAAQLAAAIEGGKLYLAAYAVGLGATGLTFFDDDVTSFFSPHAEGKSVLFLIALGHSRLRRT